jgi:hypothetical protein
MQNKITVDIFIIFLLHLRYLTKFNKTALLRRNEQKMPEICGDMLRVAEPEPDGAETFGRIRSWSRYTDVSAPAPGSGSRANLSSVLNHNSY